MSKVLYRRYIKRLIDIILSLIGLIILSPVMIIAAILIRINLGSPIIFKQERPGKDGKIFTMYKFRTMLNSKDNDGNLLPNEKRHTKFGKLLRSTSIDELPGLLNVLKGDMSLVGPRPLLVEYLSRYDEHQARRHDVRPGITGWAQVNGRNTISWEERFDYDVEYVDGYNLIMDMKILIQTAIKVFKRADVNQSEKITMTKFMGNKRTIK